MVSFGVTCRHCYIRGNGVVTLHDSLILDQVCSLFPLGGVLITYNVSLEVLLHTWGRVSICGESARRIWVQHAS
jgi:hypothetical protein